MTVHSNRLLIPDTALSVAGLTTYIQALLEEDDRLHQVWVTGEVSSANRHPKGLFFTLQDPDDKAAIACVVWSSQLSRLIATPAPGEQIILLGQIRIYPPRGEYRLVVWQALPAGEGLLALRHRQLRDRLRIEGLFSPDRKRPLPAFPQTIAVVTSPQAAAWGDIQRTLKRRSPGLRVLLSPAQVQGETAPASIVKAIRRVEQDGRAEVLILARGGGAAEDLACFNDERVVRAIATCSIPVISGIGHQRDESLADLVADDCAHTPTAAAEQAVPLLDSLVDRHQQQVEALLQAFRERLDIAQEDLERLRSRLRRLRVDQQIRHEQQAIAWKRQQLLQVVQRRLQSATQHCHLLNQKLATLDPQAVLQRGYAVVRQSNGEVVRSTAALATKQVLTLQLADGTVKVKVSKILESES